MTSKEMDVVWRGLIAQEKARHEYYIAVINNEWMPKIEAARRAEAGQPPGEEQARVLRAVLAEVAWVDHGVVIVNDRAVARDVVDALFDAEWVEGERVPSFSGRLMLTRSIRITDAGRAALDRSDR